MELKTAQVLSSEIVEILKPHCKQIMVVGSIRRGKEFPRDIDIVLIPGNQGALLMALEGLGEKMKSGPKMIQRRYKGQQVDIYIADETTWPTLVLIRTGSKEFNRMLCARAKQQGKILHADGSGIERVMGCDRAERIIPETEADIFDLLGLPYAEPRKRENGWN
jgi:DNA polymerase/3'-5' exonuclease PolX